MEALLHGFAHRPRLVLAGIVFAGLAVAAALHPGPVFATAYFIPALLPWVLMVWFPRAAASKDAANDPANRRAALQLSLGFGVLYLALFAWMMWTFLSWPNRSYLSAFIWIPALVGTLYQTQYLALTTMRRRMPGRVWPMRWIALLGGLLGSAYIPGLVAASEEWFQERQAGLVQSLQSAAAPCTTFKQYLVAHPPEGEFQTPDLYVGDANEARDGKPRFVLAFRARADMESMILFYHSGARKWVTTFRNNRSGMQDLYDRISPMKRCDGPGTPIVRLPAT